MHICHVISVPFPPEEGIGRYVHGLSTKLIEKGHRVTIITRGAWNKTEREIIDDIEIFRVTFIPIYPFYIHLHGIFLNKIFKSLESQIDILHIHTPLPPQVRTSLPVITTVHSPLITDNRYMKIRSIYSFFSKISARVISYPLELKIIKSSDIVTTVSQSIAQELKEYNLDPDEVYVVDNGVDENFFYPKPKKSQNSKKYILFAGRIDREKGLFDLVECSKYICNERSDVFFIIAGKGRDLERLRWKIKKADVQDRFKLLGQVDKDKLVELYQNSTLFVLPSHHEGLPGVLLEAMSCGLPVIATDVRGNRDLISNKKNGIIVPSSSPKEMAEAASMLIEDEQLRRFLAVNARKTIETRYTWDAVSNKLLSYYESLV